VTKWATSACGPELVVAFPGANEHGVVEVAAVSPVDGDDGEMAVVAAATEVVEWR